MGGFVCEQKAGDDIGFDLYFCPMGQKLRCCRRPVGGKQGSPGALHLDGFEPISATKKEKTTQRVVFLFLVDDIGLDLHFCLWQK